MIISHRHKFIFIHINKCAGTSITRALMPSLDEDDMVMGCTPEFEKISQENRRQGKIFKHSTAREIKAHVGDRIWNDYFKFSFVRNPWDIMVSKYFWWHKTDADWNERAEKQKRKIMSLSFDEYLEWMYPRRRFHAYLRFLTLDVLDDDLTITSERPDVAVDFVGRYENLAQDFKTVCAQLGLLRLKLDKLNASSELRGRKRYESFYDEKSIALVGEMFHREIARFDYAFGN